MTVDPSPRISRVFTRGRPFKPGNAGRPKGTRNKAAILLEAMFEGEAQAIGRKVIDLAKDGNAHAIKIVLDRAYPSRKGRVVDGVVLPAMTTLADAVAAMGAIATAVSAGVLTTDEARDLSELVEIFRKTHELVDIESRVVALEKSRARRNRSGAPIPSSAPVE